MVLMTEQAVTAELCKRVFFWCWPDNCRLSQLSGWLAASVSLIMQIDGDSHASHLTLSIFCINYEMTESGWTTVRQYQNTANTAVYSEQQWDNLTSLNILKRNHILTNNNHTVFMEHAYMKTTCIHEFCSVLIPSFLK